MGHRGRYGKYGEIKRLNRLRRSRRGYLLSRKSAIGAAGKGHPYGKTSGHRARVLVREAKVSDLDFIGQLSEKVFYLYGPYEKIVFHWFELEATFTLIGLVNKRPVAFAMIGPFPNQQNRQHVSELLAIAVEPEKQGMGIGDILLKGIEREASERRVHTLFLHTAEDNLPGRKLFARNGYQPLGIEKNFYPAGQSAVLMVKEIGSPLGDPSR